jgi:beta-lactamase regulating signal transducer with metallopeptidase domain
MTSATVLMFIGALHVKVALFSTVVLGIVCAARNASSQDRYLVLRMALGIVAVLPLLLFLPGFSVELWQRELIGYTTILQPINVGDDGRTPAIEPTHPLKTLLLTGYVSISALMLLRVAIGYLRTRNAIRRYRRITQPQVMSRLDQVRRQIDARNSVDLVLDSSGAGPYVWGIYKPVIAVPTRFLDAAPDVQRSVLAHELIHVVRHDTTVCLASRILCCLYWINPAVWFLHARLRLEMEQSCDDRAVCSGINACEYADHLLKVIAEFDATHRPELAVAMARTSSIKRRIESLLKSKRERGIMNAPKSIVIFGALSLLGSAVGVISVTNAATSPSPGGVLVARIERLVPITCQAVEVHFLSTTSVEVAGNCDTPGAVSEFMRHLDRAGYRPQLQEVARRDAHSSFKLRISNL